MLRVSDKRNEAGLIICIGLVKEPATVSRHLALYGRLCSLRIQSDTSKRIILGTKRGRGQNHNFYERINLADAEAVGSRQETDGSKQKAVSRRQIFHFSFIIFHFVWRTIRNGTNAR